jgi:signal transduction histidine kinase
MRFLGGLSIRNKLTAISTLSCLTALTSATVAYLVFDQETFRRNLERRIASEARIIGLNSVSSILFRDREAASETLGALRGEPAVSAAAILLPEGGAPLASYGKPGAPGLDEGAASSLPAGARHLGNSLLVAEPVEFEGRLLGTLVLRAELHELGERQRQFAAIAGIILLGSVALALGLSRLVEKTISAPILHLAETARIVSTGRDYSVRAAREGRDELSRLTTTFNEMLDEIQGQNLQLEEARLELERRVESRTRDLAAANQELEAFSYSVSHDLRAPLRAIDGFSRALLSSHAGQLDEQGRHYLARVRAGTARMSQLIDDLLALSRISRHELVKRPTDVSRIAAQVAADLAARPAARAVDLVVQEGMAAAADPRLLTIVLENLMGNAWKFTSKVEGARVEVGQRRDGGGPDTFYVRDNGAGFDMAYADKLFGAFQRLHGESEFEGTGIGLATVHRVVVRHGGRIWAEGEVGKGATFFFTLEGGR